MKVDIPAGIADGQRLRVTGRGHAGERGGPAGDLFVVIRVKEDERFIRDREDLVTVVDVAAPLAALGTTIQVPTLDGDVPLEVPAGTQPGETIVMAGRGLPPLGRGRTGDLRVVVNVVIPRRLSRKQRDLLEAVLRVADRGQPARERGHDREAQTGPRRVIRLGLRVRAEDAEVAYARLEPLLAAGFEEVPLGDLVEFVVYGDDLPDPSFPELVSVSRDAGRATAGRPPGTSTWSRSRSARRRSARRGSPATGSSSTRATTFGARAAPDDAAVPGAAAGAAAAPPLADWGCGCGVLVGRRRAPRASTPVTAIELDPRAVATARANGVDAHVGDVTTRPAVGADGRREPHGAAARPGRERAARRRRRSRCSPPASRRSHADVTADAWEPFGFVERERRLLDGWAAQHPGARVIRLAVRVQREHAELVLADLMAFAPGGLEERDDGDVVEYALYGAPGELPDARRRARGGRRRAGRGLDERVPDVDWHDFHIADRRGPAARSGRRGSRRARARWTSSSTRARRSAPARTPRRG